MTKKTKDLGRRLNRVKDGRLEVIDNATDRLVALYENDAQARAAGAGPFKHGPVKPGDRRDYTDRLPPVDQGREKVKRVWASWLVKANAEDLAKALGRILSREAEDAGEDAAQYFGLSSFNKKGEDQDVDCVGSHFTDYEVTVTAHPLGFERWALCMAGRADGLKYPGITPPLVMHEGLQFFKKDGSLTDCSDHDDACDFGSLTGTADQAAAKALASARGRAK